MGKKVCVCKNTEEIVIKICEVVVEKLNDKKYKFTCETKIEQENGLDSLALMNIFIEIENYFGVDLDDMLLEMGRAKTIGELVRELKRVI